MKISANFDANNAKIVSLTRGSSAGEAATFDQSAMTPNGGTLAITGSLSASSKITTSTLQVTSGATLNYVLQSDASGNASWTAATATTGGWLSDTNGYHAPGTLSVIGVGANSQANAYLTVGGTLASVAASNSYAYVATSTLTPASTKDGAAFSSGIAVATGAATTVANAFGFQANAMGKTGTGTITNTFGFYGEQGTVGTNNYGMVLRVTGSPGSVTGDILQWQSAAPAALGNINNWGNVGIGGRNTLIQAALSISGTISDNSTNAIGIYNIPTLAIANGQIGYGAYISPTVNVGPGSTSPTSYGMLIPALAKSGSGTITNAYGLVVNKPTGGTSNYTLYVDAPVGIGNSGPTASLDIITAAGVLGFKVLASTSQTSALANFLSPASTVTLFVDKNAHLGASQGTVPTNALGTGAGNGAGTSPTMTITGTDQVGQITLVTGTKVPVAGAIIATITFNQPFATAPNGVFIQFANGTSQALTRAQDPVPVTYSTTSWVLFAGTAALPISSTLVWNYWVI